MHADGEFGIRETVSWGFGCSGGEEAGRPGLCVPSRNPVVGVASEILIEFGIAEDLLSLAQEKVARMKIEPGCFLIPRVFGGGETQPAGRCQI